MLQQTQKILDNLGFTKKIPDNMKEKLIPKLCDLLEKRFIVALTLALPSEHKQELEKKMNNDDPDIEQFLMSNVPDCDEIIKREIDKFRAEIMPLLP